MTRLATLRPLRLAGSDQAIREVWRIALAALLERIVRNSANNRPAWRPAAVGVIVVAIAALLIVNTRSFMMQSLNEQSHELD